MERAALLDVVPQSLRQVILVCPPCRTHRALMTSLLGFTQAKARKAETLLRMKAVVTVNEFNRCNRPSWCSQGMKRIRFFFQDRKQERVTWNFFLFLIILKNFGGLFCRMKFYSIHRGLEVSFEMFILGWYLKLCGLKGARRRWEVGNRLH